MIACITANTSLLLYGSYFNLGTLSGSTVTIRYQQHEAKVLTRAILLSSIRTTVTVSAIVHVVEQHSSSVYIYLEN